MTKPNLNGQRKEWSKEVIQSPAEGTIKFARDPKNLE